MSSPSSPADRAPAAHAISAEVVLHELLSARHASTSEAPRSSRGIYGLIDHTGSLRYIGSTKAENETLYKRIHQRHRTGSENSSHYFSRMYNTGRMWRDPRDPSQKSDGDIAKALRNEFIAQHCRAVWVVLPDDADIARIEREVLQIAPAHAVAWNWRGMDIYNEPEVLVDATIAALALGAREREAIARQKDRHSRRGSGRTAVSTTATQSIQPALPPLPKGEFRFASLDVETANNDRSSICQIGVAFVRQDNSIETWVSYIDPQTSDWSCSRIHGITQNTVVNAPLFAEVFKLLEGGLGELTVYQHSGFDRSAISAACTKAGLMPPAWQWSDSVHVARRAWPELKGNGGHGLASLKSYLKLDFAHHDAGEDARASAEVVLLAEAAHRPFSVTRTKVIASDDDTLFEPFVDADLATHIWSRQVGETPSDSEGGIVLPNAASTETLVPHAADGSFFHPGLARRGLFTIGPKGGETRHASFEEALGLLREMDTPRWRRPNAAGNWGIVTACSWRKLP